MKRLPKPTAIFCRPFRDDDYGLVYAITEAAMRPYVEQTFGAWVEEEQYKMVLEKTKTEACRIIQKDSNDVGLITVERHASHIQLESLYLFPAAQGQGVGTVLLRDLKAESDSGQLPLRLRVLACNPARVWYQREGFIITENTPQRWFMEYRAS